MSASSEDYGAPPASFEIAFEPPLEGPGGAAYAKLTLREPTAGEMEQIYEQPENRQRAFGVALISGLPESIVRKMPISKVMEADGYLAGFIQAGQKAGARFKPS